LASRPDLQIDFFSFDIPESLAWRGFRETVSRKIWFSKNLDIKISTPHLLSLCESKRPAQDDNSG
jgi:hypothetical protein